MVTWEELETFANGKGKLSGEVVFREARKLALCDVCHATDGWQKICKQTYGNCDFNPYGERKEIAC